MPVPIQPQSAVQGQKEERLLLRLVKRADVILAILLVLGSAGLVLNAYVSDEPASKHATGQYDTTQIPLEEFVVSGGIDFGTQSVTINGSLRANNGLIIAPTLQPTSAVAGQMYYDQTSNVLSYYNGTQFVPVSGVGSATLPFGDLFLAGSSGTPGTNNFRVTGTSTGGTRTITLPDASGTVCLQSSSACGFFLQNGNSFGATAVIGTNDANALQFETNNTVVATLSAAGAANFQNSTNSATAFQVQDSAGAGLLTVDTDTRGVGGGNLVKIGNSTGTDGATTILQLDGTTADPTSNLAALNGGLFYNSTTHKVSLIENGQVKIICNTTDLGCGTGTVTLQSAYDNGNTILMTTGNNITITSPDVATDPSFIFNTQCTTCSANGGRFAVQNSGSDVFSVAPLTGTVTVTNTTTTGTGLTVVNSNASQTSTTLLNVAQSGVTTGFTGNVVNFQGTSTTGSGNLLNLSAANTTAGNALNVTANTLTTGNGVNINSTGAGLTSGSLLRVSSATTGAVATNGIVSLQATGNYTSTTNNGLMNVLANSTTAGTIVNIQGGALTSGVALNVGANTGTAIRVSSGLTTLTNATSGSGTTLNVNNSTSTGSIAVFQDNGTTVASIADGGATLFQNQTNSANGFRILNSTGGELEGVDTTDSILRLLANNTGHLSGTGTNWNTGTSLPLARSSGATVIVNGYIYHIGGCDAGSGATTTVYFARLNSDGSVGSWAATTVLPQSLCGNSATVYNGYIYVHGGGSTAAISRDVFYAKPNSDGTISAWITQDDPTNLLDHNNAGMATHNGYLYIAGGNQNDTTSLRHVFYGRINPDGSVPTFTQQTDWLPAGDHSPGETAIANGYLYVLGSANYDKFFYGRINADASVTAQTQATSTLPTAKKYSAITVMNGYMYVIAGNTGASNTIQYGALASNGDIGAFTTDTNTLPATRSICSLYAPSLNNYIYLVGCGNSSFVSQTSMYYASGSRVKVGAALDLVGYSGEGMSEGGSGGQLTAGNTAINGLLSVTGNAVFKDGAAVNNNFTVNGLTSLQTTTNTTTGFQVLNATAVPQFVVDTSNARVYVGNPTADSTGALLALDTKNTSGDPTGVNGAMYYNSNSGTFRCHENGLWAECLGTPKPNTARTTKFVANGSTAVWAGYGDVLTNVAPAGSGGSVSSNLVPSVYNDTNASIGSQAGVYGNAIYIGDRLVYQTHLDPSSTNVRIWAGLTDQDLATMAGSATPAGKFAAFRYDTGASDATWKCITRDGATATTADSGVAIADDQKFEIIIDDGVRAVFKINGQTVCTITTNLPSALLRVVNSITALDAIFKTIYVGWIYVEGDPL
ncbi:MAG: beta strand repeat-containing protein [Candidatus Saccharimonadales bacterium]